MMQSFRVLFLVTLVGIAGCESREEARRKQVANNLKQMGLALHAYHSTHADPGGKGEPEPSSEASATATPK